MKAIPLVTIITGLALLFVLAPLSSHGLVPHLINFQGKLTDTGGNPVTNPALPMTFKLYESSEGGVPFWEETQVVNVHRGIYSVVLGYTSAIEPALVSSGNLWLEVWIDLDRLAPRLQLTSAVYALRAGDSDSLSGMTPADFAAEDHGHSFAEITGTASDGQIPDDITVEHAWSAGTALEADNADTVDGYHASAFAEAVHNHSFSQITGAASDGQIPDDITIDYAATAGNADTLDGHHASAFAGSAHFHRSLAASDGNPLEALYVDAAGNVGIGTTTPSGKLEVVGDVKVTGALNAEGYLREFQLIDLDPAFGLGWEQHIAYGGIAIGSQSHVNRQMFMFTDGSGSDNIFTIASSEDTGTTWPARLVVEQDGDVGLGTGDPATRLSNSSTPASDGISQTSTSGLNWRMSGGGFALGLSLIHI